MKKKKNCLTRIFRCGVFCKERSPLSHSQQKPAVSQPKPLTRFTAFYLRTFLTPVILRHRSGVYLSEETKSRVVQIVRRLGGSEMSYSGYVENIVRQHLETYRSEIDRLLRQQ